MWPHGHGGLRCLFVFQTVLHCGRKAQQIAVETNKKAHETQTYTHGEQQGLNSPPGLDDVRNGITQTLGSCMASKIVKRQMWHRLYFHLHLLAARTDYEMQSSSNALLVNSRFHGFFCLPSPHALNSALNTYNYIFIYIYIFFFFKKKKTGLDQITYILRQSEKKLNILTLAFSVGCIFTGVWHAMATDKSSFIIPQDPSFESVLLAGRGCRAAFGFSTEMTNSLSDGWSRVL